MATLCPLDQIPIMLIAPQINTAMQHTYESLPPLAGKGFFFRRKIFEKSTVLRNLDETHFFGQGDREGYKEGSHSCVINARNKTARSL